MATKQEYKKYRVNNLPTSGLSAGDTYALNVGGGKYQTYVVSDTLQLTKEAGAEFIEKDTVAELRAITAREIWAIQNGHYKGVKLNGYYIKGDTPTPIEYYISSTSATDDGGSVFEVGGVKLEHEFVGEVNVKYFGAKGDGITDDTVRIQATTKYKNIYVPHGTYNINEEVVYGSNTTIRGDGKSKSIINASSATGVFNAGGVLCVIGDPPTLLADLGYAPKSGDMVLNVPAEVELLRDDILMILNPNEYSFSKYRPYYKEGEIVEVKNNSSGGVVDLKGQILGSRYSENTILYKMSKSEANISGITVKANPNLMVSGILIRNSTGGGLHNVRCYNSKYAAIFIDNSYRVSIDNVLGEMDNPLASPSENTHYGIVIGNSQSIYINNSNFSGTRHGFTTGGGSNYPIVNRNIRSSNCSFKSSGGVASYDHHGNAEFCSATNCIMDGGITYGGKDIDFINCSIISHGTGNYGAVFIGEALALSLRIIGSSVFFQGVPESGNKGMFIHGSVSDNCEEHGVMSISSSSFNSSSVVSVENAKGIYLTTAFTTDNNKISVKINNNNFFSNLISESTTHLTMWVRNTSSDGKIKSLDISNNQYTGTVRIENIEDVVYSSNVVKSSSHQGLYSLNCGNLNVNGNILTNNNLTNSSSTINAPIVLSTFDSAIIEGNVLNGGGLTTQRYGISLIAKSDKSSKVVIGNNSIEGQVSQLYLSSDLERIQGTVPVTLNPNGTYYADRGAIATSSDGVFIKTTDKTLKTGWVKLSESASLLVKGLVNQAAASADTATQASGATPTKAEFDALLAELRDVKTKLRTAGTLAPNTP